MCRCVIACYISVESVERRAHFTPFHAHPIAGNRVVSVSWYRGRREGRGGRGRRSEQRARDRDVGVKRGKRVGGE